MNISVSVSVVVLCCLVGFCQAVATKSQAVATSGLRSRFPGYFRTQAEQRKFITNVVRFKAQHHLELSFHACCRSYVAWKALETAENVEGKLVHIVQLPRLKQYFRVQICRQMHDCTWCECQSEKIFVQALVYKRRRAGRSLRYITVDTIAIDGCCKCFNT